MRRLLLVSTSTTHGTGYLDHCSDEIRQLFDGVERIAFVPFAAHDLDRYAAAARERFGQLDLDLQSIHGEDPAAALAACQGIFIGGGNTFRLVAALHAHGLMAPIRTRVAEEGMPYMGTSAGSNVACPTLCTTNDMPIVEPPSFEALGLVPFQINPHYLDPDPSTTHMGETRDQRLAEYLEENDRDVVALREGAMLRVDGDEMTLLGAPGGLHFRRGAAPRDLVEGANLNSLLTPA